MIRSTGIAIWHSHFAHGDSIEEGAVVISHIVKHRSFSKGPAELEGPFLPLNTAPQGFEGRSLWLINLEGLQIFAEMPLSEYVCAILDRLNGLPRPSFEIQLIVGARGKPLQVDELERMGVEDRSKGKRQRVMVGLGVVVQGHVHIALEEASSFARVIGPIGPRVVQHTSTWNVRLSDILKDQVGNLLGRELQFGDFSLDLWVVVASVGDQLVLVPVNRALRIGCIVQFLYPLVGEIYNCDQESFACLRVVVDSGPALRCWAIVMKVLERDVLGWLGKINELEPDLVVCEYNLFLDGLSRYRDLGDCQRVKGVP